MDDLDVATGTFFVVAVKKRKHCPTYQAIIDEIKAKLLKQHYIRAEGVTPLVFSQRWEYDSWAVDGKIVDRDVIRHRRYKLKRHLK